VNTLLAALILLSPAPAHRETLAEHLVAQLASRTNGNTSDFLITKTNQVYFHGTPSVVSNFWLRGVTNINATSVGRIAGSTFNVGACLSAVSPRHCITAAHVGAYPNQPAVWILDSGELYTNTVIAWTNSGDLMVCLMAQTNPCYYRVLPDITAKAQFNPALGPVPVAVRLHDASRNTPAVTSFVSGLRGNGSFGAFAWGQFTFGDYAAGDMGLVGDSSSAAICVINGESVLIGAAYTAQSCPTPGTAAANVNALMIALLPGYELSVYDLSKFPNL
jgi:hypothetical protein